MEDKQTGVPAAGNIRTACGEIRIPLAPGGYAGRCYYSAPVVHGLGPGPAGLSLAVRDAAQDADAAPLLYGDTSVWSASEDWTRIPELRIGAKLLPGQGSFVVGVKLLENTSARELTVVWTAWSAAAEQESARTPEDEPFYILEVPNYLRPGEQFAFTLVKPRGGPPVVWSITEPQGGQIREDGVYTAPDHAGVFEIKASWQDRTASVYLMIKEAGQ